MNENINLCEILRDCPKGTKFYSYIFGEETYFQGFSLYEGKPISIIIYGKKGEWQNFSLSRKGHPYSDECGECCIFPSREMRDWSKFTAPWYNSEVDMEKTDKNNNVHFYVARDKGSILSLYMGKPIRRTSEFVSSRYGKLITCATLFSNYGLNERDFDNLKWDDEPVEVFINLED